VSPYFAVAALISGASLMFALPLLPAVLELHRKSDAMPLSVVQQNAGEIRHFADSFRAYIKGLEPDLRRSASSGLAATGTLPDGTAYLVLGCPDEAIPVQENLCPVLVASNWSLRIPARVTFLKDIYTARDLDGGEAGNYRAILADGNVQLGASSSVLRWIHASGELDVGVGCRLQGRVSSDRAVCLQRDCTFLRLNAPQITISVPEGRHDIPDPFVVRELSPTVQRVLHDGDFQILPGETVRTNLVVRGKLRVGAGARVCGSLKSGKDMVLGSHACVEGSLISGRRMHIGRDCAIYGPVIAERGMFIAAGTRCGVAGKATTVSAPRIEVEEGVVIFGTLWARESGQVVERA
jgi:cytoskeletal protein CcmA (bactofilin family)